MKPFKTLQFAFMALKDRRVRSSLTILMVVIGATLMIALFGLTGGFNGFINNQFNRFSPNLLIVSTSQPLGGGFGSSSPSSSYVITDNTVNTIKLIKGVELVQPTYIGSVKLISGGKQQVQLQGTQQTNLMKISPIVQLEVGGLVSIGDSAGILLGYAVANPPGETLPFAKVGQIIRIEYTKTTTEGQIEKTSTQSRSFIVRGILAESGIPTTDRAAYVTLDAANALLQKNRKYDQILVLTVNQESNDPVEAAIKEKFREQLAVTSPRAVVRTVQNTVAGFQSFILSIAAVSMVVSGVGIITTLYTAVMERTREIGLLKALGFRRRNISMIFLSESFIIGVIGGTVGIFAGIGASQLLTSILRFGPPGAPSITPVFLPQDFVFVWLMAVGLSILAGLYPAWRGSKMDPIVALRKE